MYGENTTEVKEFVVGDVIDVLIDFDSNRIYYFNNELLQGWVACNRSLLLEGKLFTCVNLSYGTQVMLYNMETLHPKPNLNLNMKPLAYYWKWSQEAKSACIDVSADGATAVRRELPKGRNSNN